MEQINIYNKQITAHCSDLYKILDPIGSGSYGEVFLAEDKNKNKYAAKIEEKKKLKKSKSRLKDEYKIYLRLEKNNKNNCLGIPKIYGIYDSPDYIILIMELLGYNLDHKFESLDKQFKLCTTFKIAIDSINLLKQVHKSGIVHRDIKPGNFLLNLKGDILFIMDFGLSKQYIYNKNKHIEFKSDKNLIGTPRFASLNIHMGFEPSRRDDLESIAYMLIYFAKGVLPWQGLKKDKKISQFSKICEVKLCTDITELCKDLPECFNIYLKYCRNLKFEETPNYQYILKLFTDDCIKLDITPKYEWL